MPTATRRRWRDASDEERRHPAGRPVPRRRIADYDSESEEWSAHSDGGGRRRERTRPPSLPPPKASAGREKSSSSPSVDKRRRRAGSRSASRSPSRPVDERRRNAKRSGSSRPEEAEFRGSKSYHRRGRYDSEGDEGAEVKARYGEDVRTQDAEAKAAKLAEEKEQRERELKGKRLGRGCYMDEQSEISRWRPSVLSKEPRWKRIGDDEEDEEETDEVVTSATPAGDSKAAKADRGWHYPAFRGGRGSNRRPPPAQRGRRVSEDGSVAGKTCWQGEEVEERSVRRRRSSDEEVGDDEVRRHKGRTSSEEKLRRLALKRLRGINPSVGASVAANTSVSN